MNPRMRIVTDTRPYFNTPRPWWLGPLLVITVMLVLIIAAFSIMAGCATHTSPMTPSGRFAVVETIDGWCEPLWFSDGVPWDAKQLIVQCVPNPNRPATYLTGTSQQSSPLSNAMGPLGDVATPMFPLTPAP